MKSTTRRLFNNTVVMVMLILQSLLSVLLLQRENHNVVFGIIALVDGFAHLVPSSRSSSSTATAIMKMSRGTKRFSTSSSSSSSSSFSNFILYSQTKGSDSDKDNDDNDNDDNDSWDSGVDYDKGFENGAEQQESPDPSLAWGISSRLAELPVEIKNAADFKTKLGINIGSMLEPLSDQQAAELKAAAIEVINDRVAAGLDDIAALRQEMQNEMKNTAREMQRTSQLQADVATNTLLNKIDSMTENFLKSTQASRLNVKLAAAADRQNSASGGGRGIDMGSWGKLGGADVSVATTTSTSSSSSSSSSLGRSDAFFEDPQETTKQTATTIPKLLVVADIKQDEYAKLLMEPLTQQLSHVFAAKDSSSSSGGDSTSDSSTGGVQVNVYAPTATLPLGGDNSNAVLLFLTSFSSASSVKNALDRLLRKTLSSSSAGISMPPTQIVAISTVGTERTSIMPYSMQNFMGGKLDQRRQMEEAVMNMVHTRVATPALDYTIVKLGDKLVPRPRREQKQQASSSNNNSNNKNKQGDDDDDSFELKPGDVLDGPCQIDTAVQVLLQAIALQPAARNATLCAVGARRQSYIDDNNDDDDEQAFWDDVFVPLVGPEVWRCEGLLRGGCGGGGRSNNLDEVFVQLAEYIREWATLPSTSAKLTTPVQVVENPKTTSTASSLPIGVQKQVAIQFLYLPTATGSKYMSKEEERAREKESSFNKPSSSSSAPPDLKRIQARKLGGLEILVEQHCSSSSSSDTSDDDSAETSLRIRARRCNYAPGAVLKELTEDSLIARLRKCVEVWKNIHAAAA